MQKPRLNGERKLESKHPKVSSLMLHILYSVVIKQSNWSIRHHATATGTAQRHYYLLGDRNHVNQCMDSRYGMLTDMHERKPTWSFRSWHRWEESAIHNTPTTRMAQAFRFLEQSAGFWRSFGLLTIIVASRWFITTRDIPNDSGQSNVSSCHKVHEYVRLVESMLLLLGWTSRTGKVRKAWDWRWGESCSGCSMTHTVVVGIT